MGVANHEAQIGDEKIRTATGKGPSAWFDLLDQAGADAWTHARIARWLVAEHAMDGWWAQSVTVRYEQARGLRAPGQQADGTFSVSSSKTVAGDQRHALALAIAAFSAHLGTEPSSVRSEAKYQTARWRLGDGETLLATANPTKNGRTGISITRSRIRDAERAGPAKAELASVLKGLPASLD